MIAIKEFRRNKETGIVEVWENGEKIDEVYTMGNEIIKEHKIDSKKELIDMIEEIRKKRKSDS